MKIECYLILNIYDKMYMVKDMKKILNILDNIIGCWNFFFCVI